VFSCSNSSIFRTAIFFSFKYSSGYSSSPSSQRSSSVSPGSIHSCSIRVSFIMVVLPLSKNPVTINIGVAIPAPLSFSFSISCLIRGITSEVLLPSDLFRLRRYVLYNPADLLLLRILPVLNQTVSILRLSSE